MASEPKKFKAGTLKFEVYESRKAAAEAAARDVADAMQAALPTQGDGSFAVEHAALAG
jgi:hypothetical protein